MKKLILLLCIASPALAGQAYKLGNQFPPTCGTSGLFLSANGDCTSSWVSQAGPGTLLASTNTWTAQQTFTTGSPTTKTQVIKGASGQSANLTEWQTSAASPLLSIGADGTMHALSGEFDLEDATTNNYLRLLQSTTWSDHVTTQFIQAGLNSGNIHVATLFGSNAERMLFASNHWQFTHETSTNLAPPTGLFEIIQSTNNFSEPEISVLRVVAMNSNQTGRLANYEVLGTTVAYVAAGGETKIGSYTLTSIQSKVPGNVGELLYCADCGTDAVCVSTGSAAGAYSRLTSRTTACQ